VSSASALPKFVDSLVEIFGTVTPDVYDGPPVTSANKQTYVAVGWDGVTPDGGSVGTVDHTWPHVGGMDVQEDGTVTCAAVAWTGDRTVAGRRAGALELFSACEQALRDAFKDNGGELDGVRYSNLLVTAGSLDQELIDDGVRARLEFTVNYRTWI